ncbi:glycerate dehydrogenase, partial [Pseudomonas sp. SIMBA_041]
MTNNRRAVFLDHSSLDLGDLDLGALHDSFSPLKVHAHTAPEQVAERLQGAQVAISNKVALTAETLAACPDLQLILVA